MGLWRDDSPFRCPFCDAKVHRLERRGADWWCSLCHYTWFALTKEDRDYLRCERIAVDEPEADAD